MKIQEIEREFEILPEPHRDWERLRLALVLVLAALTVVSWSLFMKISNGEVVGGAKEKVFPVFSPASVESIRFLFTHRATEEKKYRTGGYYFEDPSQ